MRGWYWAAFAFSLLLLATACGIGGESSGPGKAAGQATVQLGDKAPNFALGSAAGERVSLAQYRGKKPVLLYFSMGPG
jgi:cytochrome oxidase Cu insertion factor (SCO1/SenC/PrrC family)